MQHFERRVSNIETFIQTSGPSYNFFPTFLFVPNPPALFAWLPNLKLPSLTFQLMCINTIIAVVTPIINSASSIDSNTPLQQEQKQRRIQQGRVQQQS